MIRIRSRTTISGAAVLLALMTNGANVQTTMPGRNLAFAQSSPQTTSLTVAPERSRFEMSIRAIEHELERQLNAGDGKGLSERRQRLREAFHSVPSGYAKTLYEQLHRKGDKLAHFFHQKLATATRDEMLSILRDKIEPSSRGAAPRDVATQPRPPKGQTVSVTDDAVGSLDHACDEPGECAQKGLPAMPAVRRQKQTMPKVNSDSLRLAQTNRKIPLCSPTSAKPCLDLSLFGLVDFSVYKVRPLNNVRTIVVHNGGYTAEMNSRIIVKAHEHPQKPWHKQSGAHYTIQRDGTIYQHIGEEMISMHGNGANTYGVGIELNITNYKGPSTGNKAISCNSLHDFPGVPGEGYKQACTPTVAQYTALNMLIDDFVSRTSAKRDKDHIIGHCEASGATHGDPRAFDWSKIGLSNDEKKQQLKDITKQRGKPTACDWYLPF